MTKKKEEKRRGGRKEKRKTREYQPSHTHRDNVRIPFWLQRPLSQTTAPRSRPLCSYSLSLSLTLFYPCRSTSLVQAGYDKPAQEKGVIFRCIVPAFSRCVAYIPAKQAISSRFVSLCLVTSSHSPTILFFRVRFHPYPSTLPRYLLLFF